MKRSLIIIAAFMLFSAPAHADQIQLNSRQVALLTSAQDYLAKVKTVRANFVQINPGSSIVSSGKILISKPGRLKMSYSEPYQIDYYINNDDLVQYDWDLQEVTRGTAPDNPLKVLLYNDLTLANNDIMNVTNVIEARDTFEVYLLNKTTSVRDISGLILKFRKFPLEIMSIGRVDNEGNNTQTNFSSVTINEKIDDSELSYRKLRQAFPD